MSVVELLFDEPELLLSFFCSVCDVLLFWEDVPGFFFCLVLLFELPLLSFEVVISVEPFCFELLSLLSVVFSLGAWSALSSSGTVSFTTFNSWLFFAIY